MLDADVNATCNILARLYDEEITLYMPYREVKALLAERTRTAVGTAPPGLELRGACNAVPINRERITRTGTEMYQVKEQTNVPRTNPRDAVAQLGTTSVDLRRGSRFNHVQEQTVPAQIPGQFRMKGRPQDVALTHSHLDSMTVGDPSTPPELPHLDRFR